MLFVSVFWSEIKNNSRKIRIVPVLVFITAPLSYLITYALRLGEAAYYGIPFSLVTVTITDFFRYLIPALLISMITISIAISMIKKMSHKPTISYLIVTIGVVCTYLFFLISLISIVSKIKGAKFENLDILSLVLFLLSSGLIIVGSIFPQNKSSKVKLCDKILIPFLTCIRETNKKFLIGLVCLVVLSFLLTVTENNMLAYYFLCFIALLVVPSSFTLNELEKISIKRNLQRAHDISFMGKMVLAFLTSVLFALTMAFCFSVTSLIMTINHEKTIVKLDGEDELVCVLTIYENDYAVGVEACDLGNGKYSAEIPESRDFYYFQLSNKAEVIFAADCEVKNINNNALRNAIGV